VQIILIRHAKVLINSDTKIFAKDMQEWVKSYNQAKIDTTMPSKEVIELINGANFLVSSTLKRSIDSLKLLGKEPNLSSPIFNEADIPPTNGKIIKAKPKHWLLFLRVLMFLGIGKNNASFKKSKQRAKEASNLLIELAKKHQNIALLGHGGLNFLIGKELEAKGFKCVKKGGGNSNWSYKVYSKT